MAAPSTEPSPPVDDPTYGTACVYVCCLRCHAQWFHEHAGTHCPACGDRLEAGTLKTAYRRVTWDNGL